MPLLLILFCGALSKKGGGDFVVAFVFVVIFGSFIWLCSEPDKPLPPVVPMTWEEAERLDPVGNSPEAVAEAVRALEELRKTTDDPTLDETISLWRTRVLGKHGH